MNYESWRITFQSSEQAARAAFERVSDYEEVLADHRRLVREMDVMINGDGAAKQASLCDLFSQVRVIVAERDALRKFAQKVMESWPTSGMEALDLEEAALESGLIAPVTRYEPCGDECTCAEAYHESAFKNGMDCFQKTALLTGVQP